MSRHVLLLAVFLSIPLASCGGCTTKATQQPDQVIHDNALHERSEAALSNKAAAPEAGLGTIAPDHEMPDARVLVTSSVREAPPDGRGEVKIESDPKQEAALDPSRVRKGSEEHLSRVKQTALDESGNETEFGNETEVVVPPAPPRRPAARSQVNGPADDSQVRRQAFWIPAGTAIEARLAETLSSKTHRVGDSFSAILEKDLKAGNRVVVPRGTTLVGKILLLEESGKVKGRARMAFALEELVYLGQPYPLETNTIELEAASSKKRDATVVGGAVAVGALIGAITGGKKGAAVGAATGAGAGTAGVLLTRGQAVEVEAERLFSFRLEQDFSIVIP